MLTCAAVIGASEKAKILLKTTSSVTGVCECVCVVVGVGGGCLRSTNRPDVRGSAYSPQRLRPRVHVLRVLGVGDEHDGPLLEPQVGEAEQVVVDGQDAVPADRRRSVSRAQGAATSAATSAAAAAAATAAAAAAAAARGPHLRLSIQSPSSSSRVPRGCRLCSTGISPPSVCKCPHR